MMDRSKKRRVASALTSGLLAVAMTVPMLVACSTAPVANPNETTVNPGINNGSLDSNGMFYADYATRAEEAQAGKELAVKIAEEGDVLLKNENNALPLKSTEKKVTLFGMATVHLIEAGGGSGAGSLGNQGITASTVQSSMEQAGFTVNAKTIELYEKYTALGSIYNELPTNYYTGSVTNTYRNYNDAAIVTIDRIGAENVDCLTNNVPEHLTEDEHYLQLDKNETDLIKHVKKYFNKVIVLINSANIMQIPDLAAEKTADNLGVDAILWVGTTGNNCIDAVGSILNGSVNPSGHTVDLWSADFTKDPTFTNFGHNTQNKDASGNRMNAMYYDESGRQLNYTEVEYREDIYTGYKYYEAVAYEMNAAGKDGNAWYDSRVLYPFGHGLSYTTFSWELGDIPDNALITKPNETVTMKVKVTNTGAVAGKDVVQLYYSAPYTKGGIEKASTNIVAYGKTGLLAPGESEELTIRFVAQDMASYDYDDANNNGFKGWELEKGEYTVSACRDSHTPVLSVKRTVKDGMNCETDYTTGARLDPVFVGDYTTVNDALLENKLSRVDLVNAPQPAPSSKADRTISAADIALLDSQDTYDVWQDQEGQPWYKTSVPTEWKQTAKHAQDYSDVKVKLADMAGVPITDSQWTSFMNQLTWEEMVEMVRFGTGAHALPSIGKVADTSSDGPVQVRGGTLFACAGITAATYNVDLAYEMGRHVGNDCIFGGITEWLGPGMNIHRSPFSGRNFEYYSEDGVQGSYIAAAVIRGATDMGVLTYSKHYFGNDQESYRADFGGVSTWATEQALRENYVRCFERAIKAGSMGLMSSFNRFGYVVTANNPALLNTLTRDQFGFQGAYVTDAWTKDYMPVNLMVRAGQDQLLGSGTGYPKNDITVGAYDASANMVKVPANAAEKATNTNTVNSPTHWYAVRTCAERILYTRANSLANKNCFSDISLEATIFGGVSSTAVLSVNGNPDVTVSIADNVELPAGITLGNGGATVNGDRTTVEGVYEIPVSIAADGWVTSTGVLKINVVNAYTLGGNRIISTEAVKMKAGQAFDAVIDSEYYGYGKTFAGGRSGVNKVITYYIDTDGDGPGAGQTYNRDEDKSAADIITYPFDPDDQEVAISMEVVDGALPAGLTLTPVRGMVAGHSGRADYETVTSYKLSGTPTTAGTYTVTIQVSVPNSMTVNNWIFSRQLTRYNITLTLVVE